MNQKQITRIQIQQLSKIYNSLTLISTKGQDTINMANCLQALYQLINDLSTQPDIIEEKSIQSNLKDVE